MVARNVEALRALSRDAYARSATDFGDVYEAMAMDYETRGTLHPMTEKAMVALGIKVKP